MYTRVAWGMSATCTPKKKSDCQKASSFVEIFISTA